MNLALKDKLMEIDFLHTIQAGMNWDESTQMPPKAAKIRHEIRAYMAGISQQKSTDPELAALTDELAKTPNLTDIEKAIVKKLQKDRHYYSVLDKSFYQEFSKSFSEGFQAWEEARKKNDFSIYAPKLQNIITLTKKLADALGYEGTPYDALLNLYEEGLTTEFIDQKFDILKKECIELIKKAPKCTAKLPATDYPIEKQKAMSYDLLKLMQFDIDAGVLDESTHPFTQPPHQSSHQKS